MAQDERTLELESGGDASDALAAEIAPSVRELTKLRCKFSFLAPGTLPNDGKVIEDRRASS
jgi:phenylacetate-CoA ligase